MALNLIPPEIPAPVQYPSSDGKRMAENTQQLRWITTIYGNLCALYRDDPNVFVAGDNLWYPVEGHPEICYAPDVYVVFGRPKGDRPSYKQWQENGVPLHVVFEILSPANTAEEMIEKFHFYEDHGVEEYYIYNPDTNHLYAYQRGREALVRVRNITEFRSPRLGIRFEMHDPEMVVHGPDGTPFLTFEDTAALLTQMRGEADRERQRADQATQRADQATQRATRLAELSRKARRGQATPDELAELDRLENEVAP
jgi:Uma2 family endonuclease